MATFEELSAAVKAVLLQTYPEAETQGVVLADTPTTASILLDMTLCRLIISVVATDDCRTATLEDIETDASVVFGAEVGEAGDAAIASWRTAQATTYGITEAEWDRRCAHAAMYILGDL